MLIKDWKKHLRYAWSVRFDALSIIFGAIELALPILDQMYIIDRGLFLRLSVGSMVCGRIATFISQKEFRNDEQS